MKTYRTAAVSEIHLNDRFLAPRIKTDFSSTIPSSIQQCRETGRIEAFRLNWKPGMPNEPHIFWDSDFAKVLEGMAYQLKLNPHDKKLAKELDSYVDLVISAQQPDGYLNIVFTIIRPNERWSNLFTCHELYCAGHLMEAAVAHFEATGEKKFLDCLSRYADYIDTVFGPEEGKRHGYPGHEEIELALCRLARATGNERYSRLASYFINERGKEPNYFRMEGERLKNPHDQIALKNCQAHLPAREQKTAEGHAVRAVYFYTGMADVAAADDDRSLLEAAIQLFDNIVQRRMYLTGGIGSTYVAEAFTNDFSLPNDTNYSESCASMGLVQFALRLANMTGDGRFMDILEQTLYNGALSGLSISGDKFFYVNPMQVTNENDLKERVPWFGCSCCPTSYCRFLPQLGTFCWATDETGAILHIPAAGTAMLAGREFEVGGNYPYDGRIPITIKTSGVYTLKIRIPGWCKKWDITLNGKRLNCVKENGYLSLQSAWKSADRVELNLEMPVTTVRSDSRIDSCSGKVALMRGPLVYALEEADNGAGLVRFHLPQETHFRLEEIDIQGIKTMSICGTAQEASPLPAGTLYSCEAPVYKPREFRAIPYALWQNRGKGVMLIWMPRC